MLNLPIIGLVIIASVVCILLLIYILFVSKKSEQEFDLLREEVASRLGLIYERDPEKQVHSSTRGLKKSTETVNWRIGGMMKGWEVRLENRSHRSWGMGPHSRMSMTLLLVSCRTPQDLGWPGRYAQCSPRSCLPCGWTAWSPWPPQFGIPPPPR